MGTHRVANAKPVRTYQVDRFVDYRIPRSAQIPVKAKIDAFLMNRKAGKRTEIIGKLRLRMQIIEPSGLATLYLLPRRGEVPYLFMPFFEDTVRAYRSSLRPRELCAQIEAVPHDFPFKRELIVALKNGVEQVCADLGG